MKNKKKNVLLIIEVILLAIVIALFTVCLIVQLINPESAIAMWMKDNVWDIHKSLISLKTHLPTLIQSLIYIVIIYAVCRITRMLFQLKMKKNLAITFITLIYAIISFINLGSNKNPQTFWNAQNANDYAMIKLDEVDNTKMVFYTGTNSGKFSLYASLSFIRSYDPSERRKAYCRCRKVLRPRR